MTAIPYARPGPIDNNLLQQLIALTSDARDKGSLSPAEGELLMFCLPELLNELQQSRQALANIGFTLVAGQDAMIDEAGNVTRLPSPTDL